MATKTDRLEMRLSRQQKDLLERAAAMTGQPLTGFALTHLLERAEQVLERHRKTVLTRRDGERFLRALESEAPPAPALKAALRRRRARGG